MKRTFFKLDVAKRERFLAACAEEFARHGFELASTNRIVESLGIAKGSFFKYADSKEDIYLYLIELSLEELGRIQVDPNTFSSPDILIRVRELFRSHVEYARREPVRYRMVLRAYLDIRSPLYPTLAELRAKVSASSGNSIYDGVDWELYRFPRDEVVRLLELVDFGIRQGVVQALGRDSDATALETHLNEVFSLVAGALRSGIYRYQGGRSPDEV